MTHPGEIFTGTILIVAPHMDDEALACGGLISLLPEKERIHLVYATDGMKSPSPIVPGRDSITPDLGKIRVQESISAMTLLGVPEENLCFLNLPEARLKDVEAELEEKLEKIIREVQPEHIFIPFRYDRHHDHLAVNRVANRICSQFSEPVQLVEYFIYYRWRLLPQKDIRKYIPVNQLVKIDISSAAGKKRKALDCFTSQTTIFYPWQTRPILTAKLLDEECQNPEVFLINNPANPDTKVFTSAVLWIRIAHRLEPLLQRWKYKTGSLLKRMARSNV